MRIGRVEDINRRRARMDGGEQRDGRMLTLVRTKGGDFTWRGGRL